MCVYKYWNRIRSYQLHTAFLFRKRTEKIQQEQQQQQPGLFQHHVNKDLLAMCALDAI